MIVTILFFGATASAVGKRRFDIDLPEGATVENAFEKVKSDFPALRNQKLLLSINQTYAAGDEIIGDGDELAIFTAVSGG